jgi:NADH dehydrogenase FAD-containing subunit
MTHYHCCLLSAVLESVRKQAVTGLMNLDAKMMPKTKVTDVTAEGANTIIKVHGSDGTMSPVMAQAYNLGLSPNTAFAPASMHNADSYLKQMKTLQVEGHPNIFVVGDAGSLEPNRVTQTESQAAHLIKNLPAALVGGQMLEYAVSSRKFYGITLGRSRATGQMGDFKLFSLLMWYLTGRSLFTEIVPDMSTGKV